MTWRLITIPFSHYCEKARWALDYAGLAYSEARYLPGFHLLATSLKGRGRSVPVLLADNVCLTDSTDILQFTDTRRVPGASSIWGVSDADREQIRKLEAWFDDELGPSARLIAYYHLLPLPKVLVQILGASYSPLGRAALGPLMLALREPLTKSFDLNADAANRAVARIRRVFDRCDSLLERSGAFLVGDEFSAADLTLAALTAPLLLESTPADGLPAAFEDLITSLRTRPTARHCRAMRERFRRPIYTIT